MKSPAWLDLAGLFIVVILNFTTPHGMRNYTNSIPKACQIELVLNYLCPFQQFFHFGLYFLRFGTCSLCKVRV